LFPISRDPPEGGTESDGRWLINEYLQFPISRDPPEGGTSGWYRYQTDLRYGSFQFLGIPPKGEPRPSSTLITRGLGFQFLGIPPKGER